jgi:hypothetical protein
MVRAEPVIGAEAFDARNTTAPPVLAGALSHPTDAFGR